MCMYWINQSLCKPGVAGSITGFSDLWDETVSRSPFPLMTFAVGWKLHTNKTNKQINHYNCQLTDNDHSKANPLMPVNKLAISNSN